VLSLNNAFYQVREAESRTFYELFRVEVESRTLEEMLPRFLEILQVYTLASSSRIFLYDEEEGLWRPVPSHDGCPPVSGRPRRKLLKAKSFRIAPSTQELVLDQSLTQGLQALSRREGATLFMTLLAAWQVLLSRYSGQEDVVVGAPIAGRRRTELEGLIGFFVNTLVLRTDLSGNPTFRDLLKRVREVALGAYAHQELPFQKVVEALHPKRDAIRRSLGQIAFAFQNVPRQPLKLPGLTVTPVRTDLESAKTALTLFMRETEEGLAGSLNYAADLFDAVTIGRMTEHFQTLLNAIVAGPERRLLDLPPFLERSRSELLEAIHWATEQSWHFGDDPTAGHEQGEL
jgi:hypothetical protein